ncbi:hypothetical protein [Marinobacter sp. P4B1]|uniref:hypothetical protein n=1 Tax=Marinobacter sp. P4B1 TaxID=1119533 RepID=UPI00130E99C0|nr:hypothetical protein [Marinobacter sp. P4B1]
MMFRFILGVLVGLYIANHDDFYRYMFTQASDDAKNAAYEAVYEANKKAEELQESRR